MKKFVFFSVIGLGVAAALDIPAQAHGPLFSPAPEIIFKSGTEVTLAFRNAKASGADETRKDYAPFIEANYGVTANLEVGLEVPYVRKDFGRRDANGIGDITLRTKYRFWKRDLPGAQYKATAFLKVKLPTGDDNSQPRLGSGSTDITTGLTTGYESRRWYWFASAVYRANTAGAGGLDKGDKQFLNVVGGIRPFLSDYKKPDTVLMLELNWERSGRDDLAGAALANTGGWELFLSPVVWWTYRALAIRGGIQIPISTRLNGTQPSSDYRARLEFVYHF